MNVNVFIPRDKILHFGAGLLIYIVTHALLDGFTDITQAHAKALAIGAAVVAGIAKEVYDYNSQGVEPHAHDADWKDAVATVLGGLVGYFVGL